MSSWTTATGLQKVPDRAWIKYICIMIIIGCGGRGGDGGDGEPVTHEVEVERKLMRQLDSHCHLMDDHHHGTENLNLSRKNGSMIEIGNIQSLLKCSNPQMLKCSNVQILKY